MFFFSRAQWPSKPNEEVSLTKEEAVLRVNGKELLHTTDVSLQLLPHPRIEFRSQFRLADLNFIDIRSKEGKCELLVANQPIRVQILGVTT